MTTFIAKRIYEPAVKDDGHRVLVDRLWSRGVSKEKAALDDRAKDAAPSTELRQWFGHDAAKFPEFKKRYIDEIEHNDLAQKLIGDWRKHTIVTLLYGARDEQHNEAVVLCDYLRGA